MVKANSIYEKHVHYTGINQALPEILAKEQKRAEKESESNKSGKSMLKSVKDILTFKTKEKAREKK